MFTAPDDLPTATVGSGNLTSTSDFWTPYTVYDENARMYFFTNNTVRMNILGNGNVAIGSLTPDTIPNIFQVGDGSRLRISNDLLFEN
jgi:hypothetical protein